MLGLSTSPSLKQARARRAAKPGGVPRVPPELLDRAYEALTCAQRPAAETPYSAYEAFDVRRLETCGGCAFGPMAP